MKQFLATVKWANVLTIVAQLVAVLAGALPPDTPWLPYVLSLQGILQAFMTGIGGLAHKASFGESQAPAERTAAQVISSSIVTSDALKAAAPAGSPVAVPITTLTTSSGKAV